MTAKKRTENTNAPADLRHLEQGMEATDKPVDTKRVLKRFAIYAGPELPKIVLVLVCALGATLLDIVGPYQLGRATTIIFEGATAMASSTPGAHIDFDALRMVLTVLLILYVACSACTYVQSFTMARVTQNIVLAIRKELMQKLNRLPVSFYDKQTKGDILSRVVNDVDLISATLQDGIAHALASVFTLVGVLVIMLLVSPLLTVIALCTVPFSALVTAFITKRTQRLFLAQQTSLGKLESHIEETYGGHVDVKAACYDDIAVDRFVDANTEYFNCAWRAQFMTGFLRPIVHFIGNAGYVAVCIVGAWQVLGGVIGVGDIQAFTQYMRYFTSPIALIAGIMNSIQAALASAERVFTLLDQLDMDEDTADELGERTRGKIEFDHVGFAYREGEPVIRDFSCTIEPGQTVALVGPTGAGKTTLASLLMRFYDPDMGRIRIDGTDISQLSRRELRSHIGMVLQDTWLFSGTIRENIEYGCEGASEEQFERAVRLARVDDFVRTLPLGYDTIINEEASNVSAGQRQLITIARAFIGEPEILVLDEATSDVDTRTEQLVQDAMRELSETCTSLVIAHRLSTIKNADAIIVLREGGVAEYGTHEELLAEGGYYAELFQAQFGNAGGETV